MSVIVSLALSAIGLLVPWAFKGYFDLIQELLQAPSGINFTSRVISISVIYFSLLTLQSLVSSFSNYVSSVWWYQSMSELMSDIFTQIQRLSIDFFDRNSSGKIRERTNQGAMSLVNTVDKLFRNILLRALFDVAAIVILFRINVVYGLIATLSVPLIFYLSMANRKKFTSFQKSVRKSWEKFWGIWGDTLSNARVVRAFTKEAFAQQKLDTLLGLIKKDALRVNKTLGFIRIYRGLVLDSTRVIALLYGTYLVSQGQMTLGVFMLAYTYLDKSISPLQDVAYMVEEIQKDLVSTNLLFEFLDEKPTVSDKENAVELKKVTGKVSFNNVKYSYKDRPVLRGLNLIVEPGQTVAFVGKSGAGKSTIMKLLLRLYDVDSGLIQIDNIDIRDVTQKSLRKNIAAVFQDAYLFNDTIRNNVRYGADRSGNKLVSMALEQANADIFVDKLKKGSNTVIGERGVKLSGGEQQRISIARAIIKDAPIIILDEATSSLDSESELLIQDALYNLTQSKTTFIIAHRLSTVMRADKIIVLDKGRVAEIGTHADLVKKKGIYSKLYDIQSGGYLA